MWGEGRGKARRGLGVEEAGKTRDKIRKWGEKGTKQDMKRTGKET